jgi:hypothetical protein
MAQGIETENSQPKDSVLHKKTPLGEEESFFEFSL